VSDAGGRAAVVAALEAFPARLVVAAAVAAVAAVAAAVAAVADGPVRADEWTPEQVVRHLIACEIDVHQARLSNIAMVDSPTWGWAEPAPWPGEPDLPLDGLLARFASLRATTLATIADLDDAGWARSGTHASLGVFDVRALLANAVEHDDNHLVGLVSG